MKFVTHYVQLSDSDIANLITRVNNYTQMRNYASMPSELITVYACDGVHTAIIKVSEPTN